MRLMFVLRMVVLRMVVLVRVCVIVIQVIMTAIATGFSIAVLMMGMFVFIADDRLKPSGEPKVP
jgi:hypothetical protein